MKIKKIIFLTLLVGSVASLFGVMSSSDESAPERVKLKALALKQVDSFFLPLDSVTTSNNEFYQYLETDSGAYLTFLNPLVNSLYFYNLDQRALVKKVPLAKRGPNGMGSLLSSYEIISPDTILFHSRNQRRLYVTNGQGKVLKRYPLYKEGLDVYPSSRRGAGIKKIGNKVYLNNDLGCSTDNARLSMMQMSLDLTDGSLNEFLSLPEAYETEKKTYWPRKLCHLYSTFDANTNQMVYSFPGNEEVVKYDLDQSYESLTTGSGYLGNPKAIHISRFPADPMSEFKSFLGYNRYGRIHVDPYNELFLRSYYYKTPQEQLDQNILRTKSSLIIFDKENNMLGEAELIGAHELFFTKAGMHQVLFNSNIEDSLEIRVFDYNF